ncbi:MAG: FAD-dependent oxidoreductase [Deltaproteobacteria bacterium]|nr:FAD-dependent oxidoreductase [Deltaproteobacteria bacterium]
MTRSTDGTRPTVVLGGGLTGISAALHLRDPYLLFEREDRLGGLARTEERDGFFFDRTGHWLHLRDPEIQALVAKVHGELSTPDAALVEVAREARIFSHGRETLYPFQANLHGLPPDVVHECLLGFVEALTQRGEEIPANFEEYILHHFGRGIAKHFMVPYNEKLWGVKVREITSAWCSRFVPLPDVSQVLAGAVGAGSARLGYNVNFRYPKVGGIETFTAGLARALNPAHTHFRSVPDAIDTAARTLSIGGERIAYHALISSIPLPDLVALLRKAPDAVVDAASRLRATAVRYLNVATLRPSPATWHWLYVPEPHLPFYRVGVYSNAVATMAPPGMSSFYVELASRDPIDDTTKRDVLAALVEIGAISDVNDVLFADERVIDPAYVVFDEHYADATQTIHAYLESQRIFSRGRYGAWIYNAMEDSLLAGKKAAARVMALHREEPA